MQNDNPAHNLPWFNTTVAEQVAEQLVHADQASRSAWRLVEQIEAILYEATSGNAPIDTREQAERVQTLKTCIRCICTSLRSASHAGTPPDR